MTSNQKDIVKTDLEYLLDLVKLAQVEREMGGNGNLDTLIERTQAICERNLRILGK